MITMGSLEHLFLGNNSLSGAIPSQKSEALQTIDLSYNLLSGNLPSWVNSGLQLNLVGNNFSLNSLNIWNLPGIECLQRSFPCNRDAPRYAKFSIKCGGSRIISNGIEYEADDRPLGAATYVVNSAQNWAVSNVGLFADRQNEQYEENTLAQVRGTNTPELYQSSRLSPGSLRYYGLGLENGLYTVNLFFAETGFPDRSSQSWKSLARRVFDVYILGTRQLRDFDISKEAGGVERAITKNFTVNVTENHLEIHLFWAGKGTYCTPEQGYYGPSISAISVVPNFIPTAIGSKEKNWTKLIVVLTVSVVVLLFRVKSGHRRLQSFEEVRRRWFRSCLQVVAVKQLSIASDQGKSQFIAEIATISAVQHRNLVKLHGCCFEGKRRLLVYEFLKNKSLDQALFGHSGLHLDWPTRYNICLETARGLAYLHEESRPKIIHRDVKAGNILLDAELCPKISDFGLAKLYDDQKTHISTRVAGTIGYLAPEYAMRGHLTEKADVFGFGIVALEILSGRPNSDKSMEDDKIYLLEWAWVLYENNQILDLIDQDLIEFDENEALRVVRVALLCTQGSPSMRPSMSRVVAMLAGDIELNGVITRPSYLTDWSFKDLTRRFVTQSAPTSTASENSDIHDQNMISSGQGAAPIRS
ncbi:putative LRR receptor-like serine/threonine-protein kinase [Hibiscus syriacus]|uniref:non-specific serine/threonine protein kinase n=1 Tax=Hibiscus syriacus TaxID=106335 RepID=A0A6A3BU87_HIBSY|nr:putative LRR receptor-like serine/threonine-protein kinase [Hibiscus syriacus]